MVSELSALERAISICGGQTALGKAVGKTQSHVWNWLHRSGRVPADMAASIERATKGKVKREQLRPDIYGAV